jgi:hypothetical protein
MRKQLKTSDSRADVRTPGMQTQIVQTLALQSGGWILILAIVGMWIGGARLLRRGVPQLQVPAAVYTVDINRAGEMDLVNLPEVGPGLARRILDYRARHGDFRRLADFAEVPGVGSQTLKLLAPFLIFPDQSHISNDENSNADSLLTAQGRERIAP